MTYYCFYDRADTILQTRPSGIISSSDASPVGVGLSTSPAFTSITSGRLASFPSALVSKKLSPCVDIGGSCGGSSVKFSQHQLQSMYANFITLKLDFTSPSTY